MQFPVVRANQIPAQTKGSHVRLFLSCLTALWNVSAAVDAAVTVFSQRIELSTLAEITSADAGASLDRQTSDQAESRIGDRVLSAAVEAHSGVVALTATHDFAFASSENSGELRLAGLIRIRLDSEEVTSEARSLSLRGYANAQLFLRFNTDGTYRYQMILEPFGSNSLAMAGDLTLTGADGTRTSVGYEQLSPQGTTVEGFLRAGSQDLHWSVTTTGNGGVFPSAEAWLFSPVDGEVNLRATLLLSPASGGNPVEGPSVRVEKAPAQQLLLHFSGLRVGQIYFVERSADPGDLAWLPIGTFSAVSSEASWAMDLPATPAGFYRLRGNP